MKRIEEYNMKRSDAYSMKTLEEYSIKTIEEYFMKAMRKAETLTISLCISRETLGVSFIIPMKMKNIPRSVDKDLRTSDPMVGHHCWTW